MTTAEQLLAPDDRFAKTPPLKLSSAPQVTPAHRTESAGTTALAGNRAKKANDLFETRDDDSKHFRSSQVRFLAAMILSISLALLAGCAGVVSGTNTSPSSSPNAPRITTGSLPVGSTQSSYSATLQATGGVTPYTWSTAGGQLPNGLALDSSGAIAGTPTMAGSFSFNARVSDSKAATASGGFSINISPSSTLAISTVSPNTGSTAGGITVDILGSGFQSGAVVTFGTSSAMFVNVVSATLIQAITPAQSAGIVSVTIQNSDGQRATKANSFTFSSSSPSSPILPALPQAQVNTTLPVMSGTVTNVPPGATALQNALNNANCGDTLVLPAGSSYIGNFTYSKSCSGSVSSGTGWIMLRTSTPDSTLQPGVRVNPNNVSLGARLITPGGSNSSPALTFLPSSSGLRLIGIELTSGSTMTFNVVLSGFLADGVTQVSQESQMPSFVIFDRCWIHGAPYGSTAYSTTVYVRGILMNFDNCAVIESDLRNFWSAQGHDTQAINGATGAGPQLIHDNYLEASTNPLGWGGADPKITNEVTCDITITGNYLTRPLSYLNQHLNVKILFEQKNACRTLLDGNLFENNWADGQAGMMMDINVGNQGGGCPWCTVTDLTVSNNVIRHSAGGIQIASAGSSNPTQGVKRVRVYNNVFEDIGNTQGVAGSNRYLFLISCNGSRPPCPQDIVIDHNTAVDSNTVSQIASVVNWDTSLNPPQPVSNFAFTNNTLASGSFGISGLSFGPPTGAVSWQNNLYITNISCTPANGFPGLSPWPQCVSTVAPLGYTAPGIGTPAGTLPGSSSAENYTMSSSAPYFAKATDGTMIGVNWSTLTALFK